MFENLAAKLAQRFLKDYFVMDTTQNNGSDTAFASLGVWSGFVQWHRLSLKTDVINEKLLLGLPVQLVHGSVRSVQVTVPWSKLQPSSLIDLVRGRNKQQRTDSSRADIVIVLDGISILLKVDETYHDSAIRNKRVKQRRNELQKATMKLAAAAAKDPSASDAAAATEKASWKDYIKERLRDGLLPALADRVQIHIRDLHVRLEDLETDPSSPYATGIVLESMHIQNDYTTQVDDSNPLDGLIRKVSHLNHFAMYWNAVEEHGLRRQGDLEHAILQHLTPQEITAALDRSIARRAMTVGRRMSHVDDDRAAASGAAAVGEAMVAPAPTHTYLLLPMDGTLHATLAGSSKVQRESDQPAVVFHCKIQNVHVQLRDFQCLQILRLWHCYKEYKYGLQYRHLRPTVTALEDPSAYWHYACNVIRYQLKDHRLRWCRGRLERGLAVRRQYCDLYERKLRAVSPDDAAGVRPNDELIRDLMPLTEEERTELQKIEDGLVGDLSIEDITLYRILVERRIGFTPVVPASARRTSWFSRTTSAQSLIGNDTIFDEEDVEEYERLVAYWKELTARDITAEAQEARSIVVVAWILEVDSGKLALFSPLKSTSDQTELRRLQQRYLVFHYERFAVNFELKRDFKSIAIRVTLHDFIATETRSDQLVYRVIGQDTERSPDHLNELDSEHQARQPLLSILFTKNPPSDGDFDMGLQARLYPLRVSLVPECEWIRRTKFLIRPLPQYKKASNFWNDMNMARINSWASARLTHFAKATSALDHNNIDVLIDIDCPVIAIEDGEGSILFVDLGRAFLRTKKLASVADAMMVLANSDNNSAKHSTGRSVRFDEASTAQSRDESSIGMSVRLPRSRALASTRSTSRSLMGSVKFDETVNLDSYGQYMQETDFFNDEADESNAFFYDTYEIGYKPGGVAAVKVNGSRDDILLPMDVRITIHRSILPADHTLTKMKLRCTVEEVVLCLAEAQVLLFAQIFKTWTQVLLCSVPITPSTTAINFNLRRRLPSLHVLNSLWEDTESCLSSAIDEDEFFDTHESKFAESDPITSPEANCRNNWVTADSSSIIDEDSRLIKATRRRNRSNSAFSDVSSISESSFGRSRGPVGPSYLSAENLAKLVEEDMADGSSAEGESAIESFHSVLSLNQLLVLETDLSHDIKDAERVLDELRSRLSHMRRNNTSGNSGNLETDENLKPAIRLEIDRALAELKTLRAAHRDIITQLELMESDRVSDDVSTSYYAKLSVKRAATLLERPKRTLEIASLAPSDHNLTYGLKRNILEMSFALQRTILQFRTQEPELQHANNAEGNVFVVSVSEVILVMQKYHGETKYLASIESIDGVFRSDDRSAVGETTFLVGGASDAIFSNVLPIRYPQFFSAESMEDKLLRLSVEIQHSSSLQAQMTRLNKVNASFGDMEAMPHERILGSFLLVLRRLRSGLTVNASATQALDELSPSKLSAKSPVSSLSHSDISVRFSAMRLHLFDGRLVGACAVNELRVRFVATDCQQVLKLRSQLDATCNNIQAVYFDDGCYEKAAEVFGRRDVAVALVHLRWRRQLVPPAVKGGWVIGETVPVNTLADAEDTTCWNTHMGVRVNGVLMSLNPELSRLVKGVRQINDSIMKIKESAKHQTSSVKSIRVTRLVRWRLEFNLKRSSAILLIDPLPGEPETSTSSIILSLTGRASLQPGSAAFPGSLARIALEDVVVTRLPGDWQVVEPFLANISVQSPAVSFFNSTAPLDYQMSSPWIVAIDRAIEPSLQGKTDTLTIGINLSSLRSNVLASTVGQLKQGLAVLKDIVNMIKTKKATAKGELPAKYDDTRPKDMKVVLVIRRVVLTLFRNGQSPGAMTGTHKSLSFDIDNIRLSVSRTSLLTSYSGGVSRLVATDMSCQPGICTLSGGNASDDNGARGLFLPGSDLLAITITKKSSGAERADVAIDFVVGDVECMPLPSFAFSMMTFVRACKALSASEAKHSTRADTEEIKNMHTLAREIRRVSCSLRSGELTCILPSKDIARYVQENAAKRPLNAVIFRLKLEARVFVNVSLLDQLTPTENLYARVDDRMVVEEAFRTFINKRTIGPSTAVSSEVEAQVMKFEVLRTTLNQMLSSPGYFNACEGKEQRITNPTDFTLKYHLSSTFFPTGPEDMRLYTLSAAHAVGLKADPVDVLVYISQSSGGINDAIRATLNPIIQAIKGAPTSERKGTKSSSNLQKLKEMLRRAPIICSIRVEGVRITCVPGGASRLTEAPILKLTLQQLRIGAAAVAAPLTRMSGLNGSRTPLQSKQNFAGGWLNFQLAASYHNRRLVAWEPLIEAWGADVVVGTDLTTTFGLSPIFNEVAGALEEANFQPIPLHPSPAEVIGVGRFRGISRLLRSPFQPDAAEAALDSRIPGVLTRDIDFCYLSLASCAEDTIANAMYPLMPPSDYRPLSLLPGELPVKWLKQFGFPSEMEHDSAKGSTRPTVVCHISDTKPLNVNITGAFIENLSGYLSDAHDGELRRKAPHWIRNDTGLSLRFMEVLDLERQALGEKAAQVTLSSNSQVPISLKRSLSQSCDPHTAYITVELGSFEDTIDRVSFDGLKTRTSLLSATFSYKILSKIPVDTVGLHRFPLEWNSDRRHLQTGADDATSGLLGWVIVRIALHGGIKLVTIESPLVLRNISDVDLLCEVRDHDGLSVVWRSLIQKQSLSCTGLLSVPVDLVSYLNSDLYLFSAMALPRDSLAKDESEVMGVDRTQFTPLVPPPPFSSTSLSQGVIGMQSKKFRVIVHSSSDMAGPIFLNMCSVRIGSYDHEQPARINALGVSDPTIPESRMLFIRSTVAFYNHLASPLHVQVKLPESSSSHLVMDNFKRHETTMNFAWVDIGVLECGSGMKWSGAAAGSSIELRVRLASYDGKTSRFPNWSTSTFVPIEDAGSSATSVANIVLDDVQLHDAVGLPLCIAVWLTRNHPTPKRNYKDNVHTFSDSLPVAPRVVSFYVPYWVIDSTGLDLQFQSEGYLAGQEATASSPPSNDGSSIWSGLAMSLGLGELLEDATSIYRTSRFDISLAVLMIGNEGSARLQVRRQQSDRKSFMSSWSESIPLSLAAGDYHDTTVIPPMKRKSTSITGIGTEDDMINQPFAIRSRFICAPDVFGGRFGTKMVHIVCRYSIVNETGRDLELMGAPRPTVTAFICADIRPQTIHFDDTRPVQFRPREFGWSWSGHFSIAPKRKEVTMRLKHKLKADLLIITVDIRPTKGGTCLVVFRNADPPYRIENHTVYPIEYHQTSPLFSRNKILRHHALPVDAVILPYHHAEFAWDEPEYGERSITLQLAHFGEARPDIGGKLGSFKLDHIAPGSELTIRIPTIIGFVDMDEATRVIRICERASFAKLGEEELSEGTIAPDQGILSIMLRLSHGIGVSIVDWVPQELLYARLEDFVFEVTKTRKKETGTISVGCITIDNQLWVTPYPVMLRMGSRRVRRKNRRHCALSLSWSRQRGVLDLFERIDAITEPMMINIDGNVVLPLIVLVKNIKEIRNFRSAQVSSEADRDEMLKALLGMAATERRKHRSAEVDDLCSAISYTPTTSSAARLRSRYRPLRSFAADTVRLDVAATSPQRKFYIERLRVSAVSAQISWSGLLPVASSLPRLLRPALTFENLPLFLRPFSIVHVYGTPDEHITTIRSHYVNVWRVFDICAGIVAQPTFLLKACIFTWREIVARSFETLAQGFQQSKIGITGLMSKLYQEDDITVLENLFSSIVQPFLGHAAAICEQLSKGAAAGANMLQYNASHNRASGQLLRSRNPRLFAAVNGHHDLLVDYVEGSNSGKALLSRVRAGLHLGEGYVYHIDGVRVQPTSAGIENYHMDKISSSLMGLLMTTNERILLLDSRLNNEHFCDVIWEARFDNMVYIDHREVTSTHSVIQFWYICNEGATVRADAYSAVNRSDGLDTLRCKGFFVPIDSCERLLAVTYSIRDHLVDSKVAT
ncbi:hypothetical protein MPSEU_000813200 [Mayamaea pseudoterrestris]|nr:hypothetical protein MPSEU_000813200 [Mayamaea pseudoterrestris]